MADRGPFHSLRSSRARAPLRRGLRPRVDRPVRARVDRVASAQALARCRRALLRLHRPIVVRLLDRRARAVRVQPGTIAGLVRPIARGAHAAAVA